MSGYTNAMKDTGVGCFVVSSSGDYREAFREGESADVRAFDSPLLKAIQTVEVHVKGGKKPLTLERIVDGRVGYTDEEGRKVYDGSPGMRKLFEALARRAEG